MSGSGISWAICKSAPRSRQITMPAPPTQFSTGRMPLLPPNQQRQSTEGKDSLHQFSRASYLWLGLPPVALRYVLYFRTSGFIDNAMIARHSEWTAASQDVSMTSHVTIWRQLHRLPALQRRVELKIACLAHQSLTSTAPTYLSADIQLVSEHGRRHLRSSSYRTLAVPRTRTTLGDRSFAVAGPRVWNSLSAAIRQITSYGQFR